MDLFAVIFVLWLLLGGAGFAFVALLVLAMIVGGVRDLGAYWHDRMAESRRARGLCVHCGYDLRHSPTRCPECGRARAVILRYSEGSSRGSRMLRSTSA